MSAAPLPERLRIGHVTYDVRRDQAFLDKEGARNGEEYAGHSHAGRQVIVIGEDLAVDYEAETLLHEVLHQCLRVAGADPDGDAAAGVKDVEERMVGTTAGVLLAALRDNPDLVVYLLGLDLDRADDDDGEDDGEDEAEPA